MASLANNRPEQDLYVDDETLKRIEIADLTQNIENLKSKRSILEELNGLRSKFEQVSLPTAIFASMAERLQENIRETNEKEARLLFLFELGVLN